ncbi:MAG: PKD domain-containing protein [Bacteroidota bacterium]
MKNILLFVFAFAYCQCWSQGNVITINSNLPAQMTICGAPTVFTITIYNPSPFTVTNDTLKLTLPTGMVYQPGSVTGTGVTELNISIPNKPVFLLPNIVSLAPALNITFSAAVTCNIIPYIAGGGVVENNIRVNYTANNIQNYDSYTTPTYIVKQPVLAITNVSNQSYSGSVGDTYTRCITITNSGVGELTQFTFTDVHGNGIQVNSINAGVWVNSGATETVTFNASHFTSIGNNNGLFEQGESITLCETVHVLNCFSVASNYTVKWGCNTQICQSANDAANVVFPNLIPNLVFTALNPPMNPCPGPGNPSLQILRITNAGLGQAKNIVLDIFQSNGSGYNNSLGSNIDASSLTIQTNSAAPVSLNADSTEVTSSLNCMAANATGRMFLSIASLNPGDTIYLRWNSYSCCYNACVSNGQSYFNGWAYQGSYSNFCQSSYVINTAWGRVYSQLYANLNNGLTSPSTLDSGQVGDFSFLFSNYTFQQPYPGDGTAYWKLVFTLPPCLVDSGGLHILSANGVTWLPSSKVISGNTVTAIFNGLPPFDLSQAQIKINLAVDCNGCSGGSGNVDITATYVPSTSCACQVTVSCQSAPVSILCSSPFFPIPDEPSLSDCPEGMMFRNFSFKRTSYGQPDNESGGGDGMPDLAGSLNFSAIKTNRTMFGDTITASYHGKIRTSLAHPSWQYGYASASITNGNLLSFLDAKLLIYRAGALVGTCVNFNPTIVLTGTTKKFTYNLNVGGLITAGCLPNGFVYMNSDSLVFIPRYKVTTNTTGPIFNCETTNEYYVSDIINPTLSVNKFQCDGFGITNCFVMGYRFETKDDSYYTIRSCEQQTITQEYFLSIGPCCNNYNGGNLFPYEYRNWAHINTLTAVIPPGYKFISAQFIENRTAGSGLTSTSSPVPLTPINPDSTVLIFPVQQYLEGFGGAIPLSDDGFSGKLEVIIAPSCEVTPTASQGIRYDWTFTPTNYLTGAGSYPTFLSTTQDYIIYEAPFLFLQSILPSVNAPDSSVVWNITISNSSNSSNAENTWLSAPVISGVSIVQLFDVDNNVVIPATANMYQLGTVDAAEIRNFRLTGTFTDCSQDSIIVYMGWNCTDGYPADVASYPCVPGKITLKETPLIPAVDMIVSGPAGAVQLCDETNYIVEGFNFQVGTLYNVLLTTVLPAGVVIVPGSSSLSYPDNSVFNGISDPVLISGTTWQWNLSSMNNFIGDNGLPGFLDSVYNTFKVAFKVVTNCSYTSGSSIQFNIKGNAACGLPVNQDLIPPVQLLIAGALASYTTAVSMSTTYLSPCAASSVLHVAAVNLGPTALGTTDSIAVIFPIGVNYEAGSFTGIHNAPSNGSPVQSVFNNQLVFTWKMPAGVPQGDSVVFDFNYVGTPADISCGISYFLANTFNMANVVCTSTGNACDIAVMTGSDTLAVFAFKAYLAFSNPNAYSIASPPGGEIATVNFTISNTGQEVFAANNTIISYYSDSDANGVYSAGDVFIVNDTLNALIPSNGSYQYSSDIFLPAGNACSVIARLDTTITHCSCISDQLLITIPMTVIGNDSSICSGQAINIGFPPINGYTYLWTPSAGLSDVNSASPIYTAAINTGLPDSVYFVVTANRMGCVSKDTVLIIINSNPIFSVIATDTLCFGDSTGTAMVTVTGGGTPPYNYVWNTTPVQESASASGLSAGTYSMVVVDTVGCSASQSVTIYSPAALLTANITTQTDLACNSLCNGSATITASGGNPAYAFLWNTIPVQTSASAANLCAGNYSVAVTDASGCNVVIPLTITEPPALTVSASSADGNCNAGSNATATVIANGGVGGYTYLWSNGQTAALATALSNGTYTVTVTDANSCTETSTVTIIPDVQITANATFANICEGQNTTINAIVTGGTPAYTYLWNTSQTAQSITVSPVTNFTYSVVVTDVNGCIDSVMLPIAVRASPDVYFQLDDSLGCTPLCVNFQDSSVISTGTNQQWLWDFGDGETSTLSNPNHCYYNTTIYSPIINTVTLTVTSNEGCSTTLIKNNCITVNPTPFAAFAYSPNPVTILSPIVSFQNQSQGANSWQWTLNNGLQDSVSLLQHPYYTYTDTGQFEVNLIVNNSYGCPDTITHTVIVGPDWVIYIPNAFSPNDDGVNDGFLARGYGIIEFEMLIFDRWGNQIYKTDDISKPWDGKANLGTEIAQMDVYVYVIRLTDVHKLKHKYSGIVSLLR